MVYNISAVLKDGTYVFSGTCGFVPHKGEEIKVGWNVFRVETVRYLLQEGTTYTNNVQLILEQIN